MAYNYRFMTIRELAEALFKLERGKTIDFTLDEPNTILRDPEGWYGIKVVKIFDEPYGNICMGYYGAAVTNIRSIFEETIDEYEEHLQAMIDLEEDSIKRKEYVCVDIDCLKQ